MSVCALVSAQVEISGPWQVTVKGGGTLAVPPQAAVQVRAEAQKLPVFRATGGGWGRGAKLRALVTQECTAAGALAPASLKVKAPDGTEYVRGTDWQADDLWATVGRIEGGKIPADQSVLIDYDYYPNRMCLVAVDAAGKARLVVGEPGFGIQLPPALADGETHLATVWLSGEVKELTEANLLPVDGSPRPPSEWVGSAETLCPKTLAKLRAGQPVTIVAWGDSVTNGGGVGSKRENWYQHVFLKRLQERFPKAEITLKTAAWGGGNSRGYMPRPVASTISSGTCSIPSPIWSPSSSSTTRAGKATPSRSTTPRSASCSRAMAPRSSSSLPTSSVPTGWGRPASSSTTIPGPTCRICVSLPATTGFPWPTPRVSGATSGARVSPT